MSNEPSPDNESLPRNEATFIDGICSRFERAWRAGEAPEIEDYLIETEVQGTKKIEGSLRSALLRELIATELELRRERGDRPSLGDYVPRFPEDAALIADVFAEMSSSTGRPPEENEIGRNLLFGILALQHNFIDRDALLAAFNTWVVDKSQSLGAILAGRGAVSPQRIALLEALVDEQLRQHGGDAEATLAAATSAVPDYDLLFTINDPVVRASLRPVRRARSVGDASDAPTASWRGAGRASRGGGRYRNPQFHRPGGLGDVYTAHDQELDRKVALKEIKPRYADDPDRRSRFIFEAEITGGLEHPGIVPVYGLGQYDNGRPFYAMRFIKDGNLRDAIKNFHEAEGPARDPAERVLALRELLDRFLDICDAIDYAHHRGVLHRDIKPGNVMLGRYGETLVVDWGLAKLIDRVADAEAPAEPTLRPASATGTGHTERGTAIGTIGYMPPEQATGRLDQLGPASDVYSLGATLYSLLAGKPSLRPRGEREEDRENDVRDIVDGNFPRPRAANPTVPPALDAICMKAMAREPADRYPSPRALAVDIKHWLADEPVTAYRETRSQRLARWARRHRARVQAAAVALAVVAIVSTLAAVAVARAYRNEVQALAAEQQAHKETEIHFATARSVVNDVLYKVASNELVFQPGAEAMRERLVGQAVLFSEIFLKQRRNDATVRSDAATVYREAANVRRLLGQFEPALACYGPAIALLKGLAEQFPATNEYRDRLSLVQSDLGAFYQVNGKPAEALAPSRDALKQALALRGKYPNDLSYQRSEALALVVLTAALFDIGQYEEAFRLSEQAVSLWKDLAARQNAMPSDSLYAVMAQAQVGDALREMDNPSRAREVYRDALHAAEEYEKRHPRDPDAIAVLADMRSMLGELLDADPAQANALYDKAITDLTALARERPFVPGYRNALAFTYNGRGGLRLAAKEYAAAETDCKASTKLLHALLRDRDLPNYHYGLGRALANLARIARVQTDYGQARGFFMQAIKQHERALDLNRQSALDLKFLLRCRDELKSLEANSSGTSGSGQRKR